MIENVAEIKERADIVEVLGSFLPLCKNGVNYTCNCPFHEEKTPSFVISTNKQIYHCFGCNAGGDVFKFIEEFKRVSFEEAVMEVAEICNLQVKRVKGSFDRSNYLEVLNKANTIFLDSIKDQKEVKKYLFNRGLCEDDLLLFDIGFIPKDLPKHFSLEELRYLEELGLCYKGKSGYYAPLANRISFAMRDFNHKVVGFSGRTHPYFNFKNSAKYINSKESKVFFKSKLLYNLSLAKASILKAKKAILVEGFLDAIALYKMGFKNAVATCGTAFNTTHLAQLSKIWQNLEIQLCFDSDEAGVQASLKSSELLLKQGFFSSKILSFQSGFKDLGEMLEKGVIAEFKEVEILEFWLQKSFLSLNSPQAKDNFINAFKKRIQSESNYFTKSYLIDTCARVLGVPKQFFTQKPLAKTLDNDLLLKQLFKTCLKDERSFELCLNYLEISDLGVYGKEWTQLLKGEQTEFTRGLLCDEKVGVIEYPKLKNTIKVLIKNSTTRALKASSKDLEKIKLLNLRLAQL